MKKTSKYAVAIFAAVFLYLVLAPYIQGLTAQPNSEASKNNPASMPYVTANGLFIPFAGVSTLAAIIGLASKFG
jgi:hypothetical protein